MSAGQKTAEQEIAAGFDDLRIAVEDRDYRCLEVLLDRQRELFCSLDIRDPAVPNLIGRAQELIEWATTMVKIQRSGYEKSLSAALNGKRISESYPSGEPRPPATLLSIDG